MLNIHIQYMHLWLKKNTYLVRDQKDDETMLGKKNRSWIL